MNPCMSTWFSSVAVVLLVGLPALPVAWTSAEAPDLGLQGPIGGQEDPSGSCNIAMLGTLAGQSPHCVVGECSVSCVLHIEYKQSGQEWYWCEPCNAGSAAQAPPDHVIRYDPQEQTIQACCESAF